MGKGGAARGADPGPAPDPGPVGTSVVPGGPPPAGDAAGRRPEARGAERAAGRAEAELELAPVQLQCGQQLAAPAPLPTETREVAHRRSPRVPEEDRRDWAGGLPDEVLERVAATLVSQTEAGWAAQLEDWGWGPAGIAKRLARRRLKGNCLFVFAMVCKPWRAAQRRVPGRLRTRVKSDVLLPGRAALVRWALAEGCPRAGANAFSLSTETQQTLASEAASHGDMELVRWLCGEGGFAMDEKVMAKAALGGNLELVRWLRAEGCSFTASACRAAAQGGRLRVLRWLRAEGCEWNWMTCLHAVLYGRVEVLHWARANGCEWDAATRDLAAAKLGYTDDLGNLVGV